MRSLVIAFATVVVFTLPSESLLAGGGNGGAKKNSTIAVNNNSGRIAVVILDNTNPPTNQTDFLKAGGQILQPGQSTSFKVTAGAHTATASLVGTNGVPLATNSTATVNVNVAKGKTKTVSILNPSGTAIQLAQ